MHEANVKDNFQGKGQGLLVPGQGQGLAVQGQDQVLETQDQGHGQLVSRILKAKAVSSRTPSLMCIKSVLRTVDNTVYSTVHHLILDKKILTGGLGGPRTHRTPLGYAHDRVGVNVHCGPTFSSLQGVSRRDWETPV